MICRWLSEMWRWICVYAAPILEIVSVSIARLKSAFEGTCITPPLTITQLFYSSPMFPKFCSLDSTIPQTTYSAPSP